MLVVAADSDQTCGGETADGACDPAARRAAPLLDEMRSRASAIAREELTRTLRRLGEDPEIATRLDAMAGAIVAKVLEEPSSRLRRAVSEGGEGEALVAAAVRIFGLSPRAGAGRP